MDPVLMAVIIFIVAWLIMQWTEPIIKYLTLLIIFVLLYDFVVRGDASTAAFVVSLISNSVSKAVVILQQVAKEYGSKHLTQKGIETIGNVLANNTNTSIVLLIPLMFKPKK